MRHRFGPGEQSVLPNRQAGGLERKVERTQGQAGIGKATRRDRTRVTGQARKDRYNKKRLSRKIFWSGHFLYRVFILSYTRTYMYVHYKVNRLNIKMA
jgi:hypothetical protein